MTARREVQVAVATARLQEMAAAKVTEHRRMAQAMAKLTVQQLLRQRRKRVNRRPT